MPRKIYFSCFLGTKISENKRTFSTPSWQPLNRFKMKFSQFIVRWFSSKTCFLFRFRKIVIFSKEMLMICPLWFILVSQKNKSTCHKSETWFFSRTCQEANAIFIVLFRSFLTGLELNLHRHMLSQKNVSITLSLTILRFLKGWAIILNY